MSGTDFPKSGKDVDRDRPFHRIDSPSYDETRKRASGKGDDCGCRTEEDFGERAKAVVQREKFQDAERRLPELLSGLGDGGQARLDEILKNPGFSRADRDAIEQIIATSFSETDSIVLKHVPKLAITLPAWVPVEREGVPSSAWESLPEKEMEIEGVLDNSYQTHEDYPFGQWHLWYDWNLYILPAKPFDYLRGFGNAETLECEWDCGAFGDYDFERNGPLPTLSEPGPMFGPDRDWAWPMATQYVWAAGRWIYDCGHPDKKGRMRSELHPCKAVATARWEAVQFDENENEVPAIQFMFFACRIGGYRDFEAIDGTDYEFIVDLPECPNPPGDYPIGHTPKFQQNTLVLRPRLLSKVDREPFQNARGPIAKAGEADPEIEIIAPEAGEAPKQAKIRIPLTKLGPSPPTSYGALVSLGWHDPAGSQATRVKEVQVTFLSLELPIPVVPELDELEGRHRVKKGGIRWQIKMGVNGRWRATDVADVQPDRKQIDLNHSVTMRLGEDDPIVIGMHGMEEDDSGVVLRLKLAERMIEDGRGNALEWDPHIDQLDDALAAQIGVRNIFEGFVRLFKRNLDPRLVSDKLAQVVAGEKADTGDTPNPMTLKDLMKHSGGPGRTFRGRLTGSKKKGGHGGSGKKGAKETQYILHYTMVYQDLPR